MKISTNSWHYRVINWFFNDQARTVCQYVRRLVGLFIAVIIVVTLAVPGVVLVPAALVFGLTASEGLRDVWWFQWWAKGAITSGFGVYLIGATLLTILVTVKIEDYLKRRELIREHQLAQRIEQKSSAQKTRLRTVMWEWMKAKKEKLCPIIEYE